MSERSPDGRFEMHTHRRDDESYFYCDTDYYWWIAVVETGDEIAQFSGSSFDRRGGLHEEGVERVSFDGGFVIATGYDGKVERVELPVSWQVSDDGKRITLVYADGRAGTRERHPVIATGKFGDSFFSYETQAAQEGLMAGCPAGRALLRTSPLPFTELANCHAAVEVDRGFDDSQPPQAFHAVALDRLQAVRVVPRPL